MYWHEKWKGKQMMKKLMGAKLFKKFFSCNKTHSVLIHNHFSLHLQTINIPKICNVYVPVSCTKIQIFGTRELKI